MDNVTHVCGICILFPFDFRWVVYNFFLILLYMLFPFLWFPITVHVWLFCCWASTSVYLYYHSEPSVCSVIGKEMKTQMMQVSMA